MFLTIPHETGPSALRAMLKEAKARAADGRQVFVFPDDHQRTRLTHALEVAQVATAIARAVGANATLTEGAMVHLLRFISIPIYTEMPELKINYQSMGSGGVCSLCSAALAPYNRVAFLDNGAGSEI